jgi:hypothetical protein
MIVFLLLSSWSDDDDLFPAPTPAAAKLKSTAPKKGSLFDDDD